MKSHTIAITLPVPKENLFGYLSDITNLPEWATEFCVELKYVDGRHKVVTPGGEIFFAIESDRATGVIDFKTSPDGENFSLLPSRVVGLPDGDSAYIATHFQQPTIPDDIYATECASLEREMEGIGALFSPENAGTA